MTAPARRVRKRGRIPRIPRAVARIGKIGVVVAYSSKF
jgi:hypothetical protein